MRLVSLILLAAAAFGQTYTASVFAGVLVPEDLPGATVSLDSIGGVAVDAAGDVFLSLPRYAVVMRLDAATGILTRFAGNATNGFSGDQGPAVNAQLYNPNGIAVDLAGNLYVADTGNNRIRKVSNGIITTVAGNGVSGAAVDGTAATSAPLHFPYALAIDTAGNLYISDGSGVIRKVSNGVVAGVTGAQGYFAGIAVDTAGNLFLLDATAPRVLKVSNGAATTFAGNGTYGYNGDNGPAADAQFGGDPDDGGPSGIAVDSAGNVYIADSFNGRIRRVSNGVISTVAGGSAGSQLSFPSFIAVDSVGVLYSSDPSNQTGFGGDRLRKIAGGAVTTIAGNGYVSFSGDGGPAANAQFYQPEGVAIDAAGRIYIADTQNNRVRMIANGVITTVAGTGILGFSGDNGPATSAQLSTPLAVALDPAGNLYIADTNNYRIRKVSGGVITTVPGTAGYTACGVAVDPAGNVYLSDCVKSQLLEVSKGNTSPVVVGGQYGFHAPFDLPTGFAEDSAGNLYITNSGAIFELSNGVFTTVGGGTGVAFDAAGNRYIADGNLGLVRNLSNETITTFRMTPSVPFPAYGIVVDSSGNIYGSDGLHILVLKPAGAISPPTSVSVDFVKNAASNLESVNIPSGTGFLGIAPGEIVTFKGSGLGPPQLVSARAGSDGFYPTQLSGTSIQFNGVAAPLLYASANQVAAVAPFGLTGPSAQVIVTYQGQSSVPATIQVVPSAPGLFTADGSGTGQAAAINEDGTINSASNPAPIGSVISLYATGVGQTSPAGVDGQVSTSPLARLTLPVQVYIGQNHLLLSQAQLQYAGPAPGEIAGLMQINVPLIGGLTTGSAVPVAIIVGSGTVSQSSVTIAVSAAKK
jgi:trimeric autotransporter adhesin